MDNVKRWMVYEELFIIGKDSSLYFTMQLSNKLYINNYQQYLILTVQDILVFMTEAYVGITSTSIIID